MSPDDVVATKKKFPPGSLVVIPTTDDVVWKVLFYSGSLVGETVSLRPAFHNYKTWQVPVSYDVFLDSLRAPNPLLVLAMCAR